MLDAVPVQWRVVRTIRPKYSCRTCEKVVQAAGPLKAIARGKATFGALAHVVVAKFDHHLPLYRQAEMMAAQGIDIDRSTLAGWAGQASALLDPIVSRIRETGLTAAKIHTNDTRCRCSIQGAARSRPAGSGPMSSMIAVPAPPRRRWSGIFTRDRTGSHPQQQLARFIGFLQADGYAGYDKL